MILFSHVQTLTIIGSMQLGWPLVIKEILAGINLPIMGYIPVACLLADPVLKSLLSYSETGVIMLLLVSSWLVARRRKNEPDEDGHRPITEREARSEYLLSVLFSFLFTFGLRASATLFVRYDENPTRQAVSRVAAAIPPIFLLFLFSRFWRLLRIHRRAMADAKLADIADDSKGPKERAKLKRQERRTAAAVRYLIERYAINDCSLKAASGAVSVQRDEQWPFRSQWQLVVWARQLLLFFTSFAMDCVVWYAPRQVQSASRYVFAGLAMTIIGSFWRLQASRQPYMYRVQHWLEAFLYAIDIIAIVGACVYGALTSDGQVQDAPGRVALEISLCALLIASVVVTLLVVIHNIARERVYISRLYRGFVQDYNQRKLEAKEIIDSPVKKAIADGALRIISCAWLMDKERSDTSLPRKTKVVARLLIASSAVTITAKRKLIKLLAQKCEVSRI